MSAAPGRELSVAAVIPCRNAAPYLGEAIASARAQTRAVHEIVVVDDASTDESARVADAAGVRCLRLRAQGGPAAARNAGVRAVGTDLVAFLDADDAWAPDHIATLAPLLERSDAAVAYAHMQTLGTPTPLIKRPGGDGVPFDALRLLLAWNFVPQSAAVVRRGAFWEAGGYDERPEFRSVEDYELWLRLAERFPFVGSPRVTMLYRVHPGQLSHDVARMVALTWVVRAHFARSVAERSPARAARIRRHLLRAWWAELWQAWRASDAVLFAAGLAAAPWVPARVGAHRWWASLARLAWAVSRRERLPTC